MIGGERQNRAVVGQRAVDSILLQTLLRSLMNRFPVFPSDIRIEPEAGHQIDQIAFIRMQQGTLIPVVTGEAQEYGKE